MAMNNTINTINKLEHDIDQWMLGQISFFDEISLEEIILAMDGNWAKFDQLGQQLTLENMEGSLKRLQDSGLIQSNRCSTSGSIRWKRISRKRSLFSKLRVWN